MCGRYTQGQAIVDVLGRYARLGSVRVGEGLPAPHFNIAPCMMAPVLLRDEAGLCLDAMQWGFVPHWARALDALKSRPFNARSETAASTPLFRDAFAVSRCLVPATGFYEWQGSRSPKQPHYIHTADRAAFSFAGLWSAWRGPGGEPLRTFAILTTAANDAVRPIHERMPCILEEQHEAEWLAADTPAARLAELLRPQAALRLVLHPVSDRVNRTGTDGPELTAPVTVPMPLDLFDP